MQLGCVEMGNTENDASNNEVFAENTDIYPVRGEGYTLLRIKIILYILIQ